MSIDLRHGDNLKVLPTLPACSVDAIVTDPPYGLLFMNRDWDRLVPVDVWTECLRVLKPGGHLLAFGGTRTAHRLAVAVEDAGFEIRDTITWLYGSGFPKSLDVSKAIDKAGGDPLAFRRFARAYAAAVDTSGRNHSDVDRALGLAEGGSSCYWAREDHRGGLPPRHHWEQVRDLLGLDAALGLLYDEAEREITQHATAELRPGDTISFDQRSSTERERRDVPATAAARQWQGWGTALKPASEPIIVARKPLTGTVAATVLAHGTGALNVDGCRVGTGDDRASGGVRQGPMPQPMSWGQDGRERTERASGGRWPANVVLTHAPDCADPCVEGCPVAELDAQSGTTRDGTAVQRNGGGQRIFGQGDGLTRADQGYGDSGGASRFFPTFRYQAKAPTSERPKIDGQGWPTVKPLALMRWLVRLVTPPGGLVLDPFAGTGPTLQAAELEGFDSLGVELDPHAYALACQRLGIEVAA